MFSISILHRLTERERELTIGRIGNESRVLSRVEDPDKGKPDPSLERENLDPDMCQHMIY